jgi:hypothetical protein
LPVTRVQLIAPNGETKEVEGPVHPNFPLLLKIAQARDADGHHVNIFLSGEASSGKTTACKQLADTFAIGKIIYAESAKDKDPSWLIYIKPTYYYETAPVDVG